MPVTAAVTAALTDREILLRACLLDDGDDTSRLALADWLEGDAPPLPPMKCPMCCWPGGRKRGDACLVCHGTKTVPDDTDARHGELIRVQCELARHDGKHDNLYDKSGERHGNCRLCQLRGLNGTLGPMLRARLLPACPACSGSGITDYGHIGADTCYLCQSDSGAVVGSGVCPGTIERGLACVEVPLAVLGGERNERCEYSAHWGELHGAWTPNKRCSKCGGSGRVHVWHPSAFARDCVRRGVWLRVSDREPADRVTINGQWYWFEDNRNALGNWTDKSHLPRSVFDLLPSATPDTIGLPFPTVDAAQRALGAVLVRAAMG